MQPCLTKGVQNDIWKHLRQKEKIIIYANGLIGGLSVELSPSFIKPKGGKM